MIWNYLWILWLLSLLFLRIHFYGLRYLKDFIAKPSKTRFSTPQIIFQVTTKGNIPIVQNTVNQVHKVCRKIGYIKYDVRVVTEVEEKFQNCRTRVVPKEYSCNAVYKARALQYEVEQRRKESLNGSDTYIFHLDDQSIITEQTLYSILSYLESDDPAPISEGLIIYPLEKDEPLRFTHLMDTLRPFCCFECVYFMKNGNPAYIHGSNLLVRADVEEQIGWDNGKTIAEDTLFVLEAKKILGSQAFGWHGGVVEEKSPYTIRDAIKQRKRWFHGLIQNLKYIPLPMKIEQILRGLLWAIGFPSGILSFLVFFVPQYIPEMLRMPLFFATLLWLGSYQIGAYLNSKNLNLSKRIVFHIATLISSPLIGLIECATPILAIIKKPKGFMIVKK